MTDVKNKLKILIVEDHSLTRFGLKTVFEAQNFIEKVYEAENGMGAVEVVKNNNPDVVILDLGLPDMDGIQVCEQIKLVNSTSRIIILTSHNDEEEILKCFKAGANSYCMKEIAPEVLVEVVKYVQQGAAWLDPGVASVVLKNIGNDVSGISEKTSGEEFGLTPREKDVLRLIVDGFSNIEIAEKLSVSIHTAKAHVCGILQKLAVQDRTQAAIKALKLKII